MTTIPRGVRLFTLVQRELREYRISLVWTPIAIASLLSALMLVSVLLGGRIAAFGDGMIEVMFDREMDLAPAIVIEVKHDDDASVPAPPAPPSTEGTLVAKPTEAPLPEEEWNFSREWRFEADGRRDRGEYSTRSEGGLDPVLGLPHLLLMIVLVLVSANYLLGCLYTDRRDRSVLFWKSMPVSEWEEVSARLGIALIVAPAIFIAVSILLQLVLVLLAMLLVWQLDLNPFESVLGTVNFGSLFARQLGGWLLTALWIAPVYAWLLLASSWARRSPFLSALAPVVALALAEIILFGSQHVMRAVSHHLPGFIGGGSQAQPVLDSVYWQGFDWVGLVSGLLFAAACVAGAAYLRRYRFEI